MQPAREVLDALGAFGAVGVRVKVPRAVVAPVFEEFDQEETPA